MATHSAQLELSTQGNSEVIDLSAGVAAVVLAAGVEQGLACISVRGSTAAVTTMPYEPAAVHDLRTTLDRIVPSDFDYEHNRLSQDSNTHAHIRASIIGPSVTIPIEDQRLAIETWQQVVLLDFDEHPRQRTVVVQIAY